MYFINPKVGWLGVNDGQTLYTNDGGKTFRLQKTNLGRDPITDLHFINMKEGWAVTPHLMKGGYILHTVDGGAYWQVQARTHKYGVGVRFMDKASGWVVLEDGTSLTTSDGGTTWKQSSSQMPDGVRLSAVKFRNHTEAWGIVNEKRLVTTRNRGTTWETVEGSFGSPSATTGNKNWIHKMAKEQSSASFNLTNAHILEDGHGWGVGAIIASPRVGYNIAIGDDDTHRVRDTIGQIYRTTDFGKSWHHQLGEQSGTFRDVLFLDEQHGWIAGNNGILLSTEDSGKTWKALDSGTTQRIVDIHFVSLQPKWGWAMLRDANLLYTQDGLQWTTQNTHEQITPEDPFAINDVAFGKFSEGWAVGEAGAIVHNPDGGLIWKQQPSSTGKNLTGVDMKFAPLGWAVGTNGVIQRTINGGKYWKFHETDTGYDLYGVSFISQRRGWAVGRAGIILSTSDGGFTWESKFSNVSETLYDILPLSEKEIYAVGASGTIIRSTDGGETWEPEHTGTSKNLYAITQVKDGGSLWVVGQLGVVMRHPMQ